MAVIGAGRPCGLAPGVLSRGHAEANAVRALAFAVAVALATAVSPACLQAGRPVHPPERVNAPILSARAVEELVAAADDALDQAQSDGQAGRLEAVLGGESLARARRLLQERARRGERLEARSVDRRLVHWSRRGGELEAVLQVRAEERLTTTAESSAAWARILRQWWTRLSWSGGGWLVVDDQDLAPDRWYQPPGGPP
jgi:hypothetical protein